MVSLAACASGPGMVPSPRPIVNTQGVRIQADRERMNEVNQWLTAQQRNIVEDPSFWVIARATTENVYVWEGMQVSNDSVTVQVNVTAPDSRLVHEIYGHYHLMASLNRLEEWLPEAVGAEGYDLERAIMARCADAWTLGRTVFDIAPYDPLDELIYAHDAGYLDAFLFTARPDEFAEERAEWARANPGRADEYREWFLATFNREPPGLRAE